MKNRHIFFAALAVLLAGLIGWRFFGVQPALTTPQPVGPKPSPSAAANPPDKPQPIAATEPASNPSRSAPVNADVAAINAAAVQARTKQFQQVLDAENAKPQDYYGKVIDQYGNPVPNATVAGNILLNVGFESSRRESHATTTDNQGLFQFTGLHGADLGVTVRKEGYEMEARGRGYKGPANGKQPTPADPAVFILWKLHGAEPMVHWQLNRIGLTVDGTANSFDLLAGKRASGTGDIVVQFARTPLNIEQRKSFDWVLTLQIPTGGFAEITGPYANEAPAEGYQPTVTVAMPAGAKNWTPSFDHAYFFMARNGQVFGRMTVHLVGDYLTPPTHFELEVYANPSGSRNLEFDEAKQIKP